MPLEHARKALTGATDVIAYAVTSRKALLEPLRHSDFDDVAVDTIHHQPFCVLLDRHVYYPHIHDGVKGVGSVPINAVPDKRGSFLSAGN